MGLRLTSRGYDYINARNKTEFNVDMKKGQNDAVCL